MFGKTAISSAFFGIAVIAALPAIAQDDAPATAGTAASKGIDGISPVFDLVGNSAENTKGGMRQGYKQSGWIKLGATFDFGELFGWKGTTLDVYAADFGGGNLSRSVVGNSISAQQTWRPVAGGRLTQLALNHKFDNGFSITGGRVALNTYFNKSPLDCNFQSNAMCLTPYGPITDQGITAYPNSSWGGVVRFDVPNTHWYVQSGAFDYNNDLNLAHKNGLDFSAGKGTGTLSATEFGYEDKGTDGRLPGVYRLGYYHNTDPGSSLYYDINGNRAGLTGKPKATLTGGRMAWYGMFDQTVWRHGSRKLEVFARGFVNTGNAQAVKQFGAVGAVLTGTFGSRTDDTLQMFISDTRFDPKEVDYLADVRAKHHGQGAPHANEYISELSYGIAVARGVRVMPNIQYVMNPDPIYASGRTRNLPNALILGLRVDIHVAQWLGY
jgi:porin